MDLTSDEPGAAVDEALDEGLDEALDEELDEELDEALRALAEPRRRAILRLVAADELPAGQIAAHFDVTRQAVSQHLQLLKDAGLVAERRLGTRRLYRARPDALAGLHAFLDAMWADSLSLARRLVEDDKGLSDDAIGTG